MAHIMQTSVARLLSERKEYDEYYLFAARTDVSEFPS